MAKTYDVTIATSCVDSTVRLDERTSLNTAASFVSLAKSGFYDDTVFHRIVPGFVIQGRDPTGTGTGGPGYTVRDVPQRDAAYTEGVVAMAKTGAEPPGCSGSQSSIVIASDAGFPPDDALHGEVTKGHRPGHGDRRIGDAASGRPGRRCAPFAIEGMTVRES